MPTDEHRFYAFSTTDAMANFQRDVFGIFMAQPWFILLDLSVMRITETPEWAQAGGGATGPR